MEEKLCLNCQKPVGPGRSDKKYCSDLCKTEYNNRQKEPAPVVPAFVAEINKIILNNWKILHECRDGKTSLPMKVSELNGRNFNFKFFTSERVNELNGEVYYFCYDEGYKYVESETKVIIVQNDQMVRLSGPAFPAKADRLG